REILVKHRIKKSYRLKQIDEPLRKQRTVREAGLMERAKRAKVNVPNILKVDKKNSTIEMDLIKGKRIDLVLTPKNVEQAGAGIGRLHEANIIHGDLTTSNILVKQGKIFFIDFGLGEVASSVEKRGVDIRVFKESINATKPAKLDELMKAFWKGYKKECRGAETVIQRLEQIEKRGRYKER
ncbi:MAG: KEOPS complex kinase/ATPase Bud32, partial [archaeon]